MIIVWRAWVIFPLARWLLIGPIVLLVAFIGRFKSKFTVSVADLNGLVSTIVFFAFSYGSSTLAVAVSNSDLIGHWITARYALSIGTNVVTTMLIAYKFWYVNLTDAHTHTSDLFVRTHRKTIKQVEKQSTVLNVLFLMIESGIVYALLQVIN